MTGDRLLGLQEFVDLLPGMSCDEQVLIAGQAGLVLSENYVHLPGRRRATSTDPVAACMRLRERAERDAFSGPRGEFDFHTELASIFSRLRDRHTRYLLPDPFATACAYLPFTLDVAIHDGRQVAVVTTVMSSVSIRTLKPGVQVTHWNGTPIGHILAWLERTHASPRELTVRPLRTVPLPTEDWVVLTYTSSAGGTHDAKVDWSVRTDTAAKSLMSTDHGADQAVDPIARATELTAASVGANWSCDISPFERPEKARSVDTPFGLFGCLTLPTFVTGDPSSFVRDIQASIANLPAEGLIIDVRGNTGGSLVAAIGTARLLWKGDIRPIVSNFRTTIANLRICQAYVDAHGDADLQASIPLLQESLARHTEFTEMQPIATHAADGIDRAYEGPIAVLVDRFSYSATDVFAAVVTDCEMGPTIGTTGPNTGGGGANVWTHSLLCGLARMDEANLKYRYLPRRADFSFAMRALYRQSPDGAGNAAVPIEGKGVTVDTMHEPTLRDVLAARPDMLNAAAAQLYNQRR